MNNEMDLEISNTENLNIKRTVFENVKAYDA